MKKMALLTFFSVATIYGQNVPYRVTQSGNILKVTHAKGEKIFLADMGFEQLDNYRLEFSLKDLQPGFGGGGGGGGSGEGGNASFQGLSEESLLSLANKLYFQKNVPSSLQYIDEILQRNPQHVRALTMKGSLLYTLGQKELALASWKKASELEPNNAQLQNLLRANQPTSTKPQEGTSR